MIESSAFVYTNMSEVADHGKGVVFTRKNNLFPLENYKIFFANDVEKDIIRCMYASKTEIFHIGFSTRPWLIKFHLVEILTSRVFSCCLLNFIWSEFYLQGFLILPIKFHLVEIIPSRVFSSCILNLILPTASNASYAAAPAGPPGEVCCSSSVGYQNFPCLNFTI